MSQITITIITVNTIEIRTVDNNDASIDLMLDDVFGGTATVERDPWITLHHGRQVTAYVDDEAILKGHPLNATATAMRGADAPTHEPLHGTVVLIPGRRT
jgi:hypothetical protein